MGYSMQLEEDTIHIESEFFSPLLIENRTVYKDDGFSMELNDISLNQFHLISGRHISKKESQFSIHFDTTFYVTHFALNHTVSNNKQNTYKTYHQEKEQIESGSFGENQEYEFFELAVQPSFLEKMTDGEIVFGQLHYKENVDKGYNLIQPKMLQYIMDINTNPFSGALQQFYLETKAAELFLLQIQGLKSCSSQNSRLKINDIECLHEAKSYIEQNYHHPCSIVELARKIGINQTKLKNGFKELFGNTIFGYIRDLQMEEALQLLLDKKLYVSEVADQIGYKHAQHFTAAFKRKFGILPSELK